MTYQYDQLGRLIAAATTGPEWGQSYVYDGFGNLTQQVVTKGTAPSMSMMVDANTNRLTGGGITYDPVGNMTSNGTVTMAYDRKNRIKSAAGETYLYSHRNERVLVTKAGGAKEINFYGVFGELLGVYKAELNSATGYYVAVRVAAKERLYFAGRLFLLGGEKVISDRLGSVVRKGAQSYRYYPYGQEVGGATANDTEKFGTYHRDQASGLDYARNRYYTSQWGRFTSPDPYQASGGPADPGSWNRYSYVENDSINFFDPIGLYQCKPGEGCFNEPDCDDLRTKWAPGTGPCIFFGAAPPKKPRTYYLVVQSMGRNNPADCYRVPENGGPVTREVTYQLVFYEEGMPSPMGYSAVITEHLTGDISITGSTSKSGDRPGWFPDIHIIGIGYSVQSGTQRFTAVIDDIQWNLPVMGGHSKEQCLISKSIRAIYL